MKRKKGNQAVQRRVDQISMIGQLGKSRESGCEVSQRGTLGFQERDSLKPPDPMVKSKARVSANVSLGG